MNAGATAERGVDLVFPKRGLRSLESVLVYSGYPIGLFRKGRVHPMPEERLVYPAPARVAPVPPDPRETEGGDPRSFLRGRGAEIRNLREAGFGDDPRDVHWPQTARQGKFIVKERASEEGRDAIVVLDVTGPRGRRPRGTPGSRRPSPRRPASRSSFSPAETARGSSSATRSSRPAQAPRTAAASSARSPSWRPPTGPPGPGRLPASVAVFRSGTRGRAA